jgi:2-polyprenyl-6-methoxyphenol hydroxylase-like FAD-dependent oxidoreductase
MTTQTQAMNVLVVGAGPVGLFTALCAARRGLQVELIDQNWRGFARGHATLLHAYSLRLLGELGVREKIEAVGQTLDRVTISVERERVATLALPEPALAVPQTVLEDVLLDAVRKAGLELRAPYQATSIAQTRDQVRIGVIRRELVRLGSPVQYSEWEPVESFSWQADYVIGADGYHSGIRAAVGMEAADLNGAETFAIFEFPSAVPASSAIELTFDGNLGSTLISLPGGRARAAFRTMRGFDEIQDVEHLRRLVKARMPGYQGVGDGIDWGLMTHFERRLVRRFGSGRVWLAGDAAHVTSPFGGQSMNAGLREGYEYVSRIAGSANTADAQESLAAFAEAQSREWYRLLGVNVTFELLPHAPLWLKDHARQVVPALPATMPEIDGLLRELGVAIH